MYYVYLLRSINFPEQTYRGYTEDLKTRFKDHNAGKSKHTAKFAPWELVSYHAFADEKKGTGIRILFKNRLRQGVYK